MSNKPKHTPGPWRVGDAGHAIFGPKDSGMYPNAPITIVRGLANKANAALIAAAPEMLEALKQAKVRLECAGLNDSTLDVIKAALAKARGEA